MFSVFFGDLDWSPVVLTFQLATVTTCFLILAGIPVAYLLAYGNFRGKSIVETVLSMPLVLPPSVLGFYLLLVMGTGSTPGRWLQEILGFRLAFSFSGLVVGSVIFSFPFMVEPVKSGFQSLPPSLKEASRTLGKGRVVTFFRVLLPNIRPSLLNGVVLSFAHTVGEFGVVLMIGGSIPGQTRVASIAIYDQVEALQYDRANAYAFVLFLTTFFILLLVHVLNKKGKVHPL